jgi:type I restriction enzyme S subunit
MTGEGASIWGNYKLGDLVSFVTGKLDSNAAKPNGEYPFFTCSRETFKTDTYSFDCECVLLAGNNAAGIYPLKYFKGKFDAYQRTYIIRSTDNRRLTNRFLFYALQPKLELLKSISTGVATKFLTLTILKDQTLSIPHVDIQEKIAAILSAYDDLIENNTRRIKILEEMAQSIYREWFVNFRFPGHEKVKMVDSSMGKIPEGWTSSTVGEACQSLVDGDWIETKDQGGNDFRLLQVSNIGVGEFIETGNFRYVTQDTFKKLNCTEVLPGQILISRMPKPTGRAWLVTEMPWRIITAVDVAILSANKNTLAPLLFVNILNLPEQLKLVAKHSTGTTRERISKSALSKLPVMLPPLPLQEKFSDIVDSCYRKITFLRKKNNILRQTRDLLLPKLISGELDVSDLDIKTIVVGNG